MSISRLLKLQERQRGLTKDESQVLKEITAILDASDGGVKQGGNNRPLSMDRISVEDFINSSFDLGWIYPDGKIYPVRLAHENEFDYDDAFNDGLVRLSINRGRIWKKRNPDASGGTELTVIGGDINIETRRDLTDKQVISLNSLFDNVQHEHVFVSNGDSGGEKYTPAIVKEQGIRKLVKPNKQLAEASPQQSDASGSRPSVERSIKANNARFKDAYGTTSPDGDGDCYQAAINLSETIADRLKLPDSSVRVVHGIPLGTGGEAEGIRYGHAWVEVARNGWAEYDSIMSSITSLTSMMEKTKDRESLAAARQKINDLRRDLMRIEAEEITVYDYSNGNRHELPRILYYSFGNIDREHARYYSKVDVARQIVKNQHLGPWE